MDSENKPIDRVAIRAVAQAAINNEWVKRIEFDPLANPAAILALLDSLDRTEQDLSDARTQLESAAEELRESGAAKAWKRAILYTDTINGEQTCRDDLWAITTAELVTLEKCALPAAPEAAAPQAAPVPVTDEQQAKDAARYRWLRAQDWFDDTLCVLRNPKQVLQNNRGLGADCPSRDRLDAAIDAAQQSPGSPAAEGESK